MEEAAALYAQLLAYTLRMAKGVAGECVLALPPEDRSFGEALLQGDPSLLLDTQEGEDLGERMDRAFQRRFAAGDERVVLIGSDCPYLTLSYLEAAFEGLARAEAVFGLAVDGGYVLVGQRERSRAAIFSEIPWSSEKVWIKTRGALEAEGIAYETLGALDDIDDVESLRRYLMGGGACPLVIPPHLHTRLG
jgi:rSAM/selenodomain-associated transferase 1